MASAIKRTYSTRHNSLHMPSSSSEIDSSSSTTSAKRALTDPASIQNSRTTKRPRLLPLDPPVEKTKSHTKKKPETPKKSAADKKSKQQALTQLHFALDTSTLRSCAKCALTYTRGAPADESLHKTHCSRVQRGAEWGREEERDAARAGVVQIECGVRLKEGQKGRIVAVPADVGGKVGSKVSCY
jgi:N-acetyltransferase